MCPLLTLLLVGCEGMRFAQYSGQQKTWPVGSSFSDKVYEVPVFRSWPEKAYDVLGYIEFKNPNTDWNEGDVKQAAGTAKKMGGDAIIMVPKGDSGNRAMETMRADLGIAAKGAAAIVLKWK
jgi:hypothetical protein